MDRTVFRVLDEINELGVGRGVAFRFQPQVPPGFGRSAGVAWKPELLSVELVNGQRPAICPAAGQREWGGSVRCTPQDPPKGAPYAVRELWIHHGRRPVVDAEPAADALKWWRVAGITGDYRRPLFRLGHRASNRLLGSFSDRGGAAASDPLSGDRGTGGPDEFGVLV